jgi:hypothetical protein
VEKNQTNMGKVFTLLAYLPFLSWEGGTLELEESML